MVLSEADVNSCHLRHLPLPALRSKCTLGTQFGGGGGKIGKGGRGPGVRVTSPPCSIALIPMSLISIEVRRDKS